jgi:regulator of protease activity HflC (stomatin/prohibitin superfamily)
MSVAQRARRAAASLAQGADPGQVVADVAGQVAEGYALDPGDFLAARDQGASIGTVIEQQSASLGDAGEVINQSKTDRTATGLKHVISPVVIPKSGARAFGIAVLMLVLVGGGLVGLLFNQLVEKEQLTFFGPHYWAVVAVVAVFLWWRRSMVMVPEGCQALITKFGKLVHTVGPGRVTLFNPWKRVSYIVNTTKEYPFNAPIHEAPTQEGVKASVDLFLQFRIEDPAEFIFVLGSVQGFQSKLENAVSEVTRSLIYAQRAGDIYDLVGESTSGMLENLNQQFLPAVRLTNVNITHAEPSSQEYRMDLASPEMVRVAKEAYTYEYELQLRKEQNEGDLNKDIASLYETLSAIKAEIATSQAQMDTAYERETNRAQAVARQRFIEAESTAKATAALLEAQALDIKAVSAAEAPEILEYSFRQELLDRLEAVADSLPQVVHVGEGGDDIDFLTIAQRLVGTGDEALFSDADTAAVHARKAEIEARIRGREAEIAALLAAGQRAAKPDAEAEPAQDAPDEGEPAAPRGAAGPGAAAPPDIPAAAPPGASGAAHGAPPGEDRMEQIRQSVTDESIGRRIERLAGGDGNVEGEQS